MPKLGQLRVTLVGISAAIVVAAVACSGDDSTSASGCADGELACNGACVEPMTDPANCGGCGVKCVGGQLCSAGVCSLTCSPGTTQCNATCSDIKVDPQNCGGCGTACAPGQICAGGSCVAQCPSGQNVCVGDAGVSCVTTMTDSANCGGCGNTCAPGQVCSGGMCGNTCGAGETLCPPGDAGAAHCARTQTDQSNCGTCGTVCGTGLVCSGGSCIGQCVPPLTLCGSQCVDTNSDRENCGGCGKPVCKGATPTCSAGMCSATCAPSGSRVAFNTLNSHTTTGCWNGNPCAQGTYVWTSTNGQSFKNATENVVCGGTTGCVKHVGITTYQSSSNCQGIYDAYCDSTKVGSIDTTGKACQGDAMTNGCSTTFSPVTCSTIKLVATSGSIGGCCGGGTIDTMVTGVSAW